MKGKVCVVTGATSGIGKATAAALAGLGAQVVLVGRDRGRAEATAAELGRAGARPRFEIADFTSMGQVRELAGRLEALEHIDVLVNGGYYVKKVRREPSAAARDDDAARRLWQLSEELTGLTQGLQREVR
jgi:NAD(P)-dependent dehydrogenase (short-subunit alcohol dehydrogenase family)